MGEPMGAGGALNAALVLKAWQHPDSGVAPAGPVLVNSASLGGTHFSLALAPYAA
jgi:3-oxoacyl-[acyl-carrier-protein] synthase II